MGETDFSSCTSKNWLFSVGVGCCTSILCEWKMKMKTILLIKKVKQLVIQSVQNQDQVEF